MWDNHFGEAAVLDYRYYDKTFQQSKPDLVYEQNKRFLQM